MLRLPILHFLALLFGPDTILWQSAEEGLDATKYPRKIGDNQEK